MAKERKLIVLMVMLFCSMFLVGCEASNGIMAATFSDITGDGSQDMTVRVSYTEDKRLLDKYVDILIMSDAPNVTFLLKEEGNEPYNISIAKAGQWYSITSLIASASGLENTESFDKFKTAVPKTYIIKSKTEFKLSFKAVIGDIEDNSAGTGKILTNKQDISKEFSLNIEKQEEK